MTPVEIELLLGWRVPEFYERLLQETCTDISSGQGKMFIVQEPSIAELRAVMTILYFSGYHNVPNR